MVYFLSPGSAGVEGINSATWDIIDVPSEDVNRLLEYANPDSVHPSALQDNAIRRQQGYWLRPDTLPKKVLWAKGTTPTLPDVLFWFAVSPRFKALVEKFEPDVHQFVPVEIFHSRDGAPVATYYWFVVGQRIDSVDRERTTYAWKTSKYGDGHGFWSSRSFNPETLDFAEIPDAKLFFSNRQVEGHHIWHDPHVLTFNNGLCSDAFAEAVLASGMTGVAVTPRDSV